LPEGDGDTKYAHAGSLVESWRAAGVIVRDPQPALYRYDQTFSPPGGGSRRTRRGFLGLVRLRPFADRVVLPHERTLSGPKEDRLKLFRATRMNLSPGFMLYRDERGDLDAALERADIVARFSTPDGIEHVLSKVTEREALETIVGGVARSPLLIADGHHRYETALRYSQEVDAAHPGAHPRGEHRYFMTFLANGDSPDLLVFPTHRHVHSLPTFSFDDLVRGMGTLFAVRELPAGADADRILAALGDAGVQGPSIAAAGPDGRVFLLALRGDANLSASRALAQRPAALQRTDVTLLHAAVLEDLLGITPEAQAAKTNLWYPQDARAALAEVRGGRGQVLFLMNATPVSQVRAVAEAGEVMPQKSTFFYPKVVTGLAFHTLDPAREVASIH
jgi:uncharacterized protein (DUF1015 family)